MHVERDAQRLRRRAQISVESVPDRSTWARLWAMYFEAFEPMQELALLNHLYQRSDFEALLADARVAKLIATIDGEPVGLAMITPELEVVPQISPAYLHRRFPEQAARKAVFFGVMVFVAESHRRSSTFARLVAGMGEITAQASGVVVFDICQHNVDELSLDRQMSSIARWFPGSSFERIDAQNYYAVSLPAAAGDELPVSLPVGVNTARRDPVATARLRPASA